MTFNKSEAVQALGISSIAFNRAAERLIQKKQLIHPARGFFVIVPAEYRSMGAPPVTWFIDSLMGFHQQPYYVGLLSAAAFHGAAHQAPQEFQVITNTPLREIRVGGTRIRFLTKKHLEATPTQPIRTPYGDIPISTPEATAFDLIRYVRRAGGLSHVATLLIELSEKMDPHKLAAVAKKNSMLAETQRLGYLLEAYTNPDLTSDLHPWIAQHPPEFVALRPNWKPPQFFKIKKIDKWRILVNEIVEPDL